MEKLTQIAGFFLGDGFWLNGKMAFSNTDEELIKRYSSLLKSIGVDSKLYRRNKTGNRKDEFTLVAENRLTKDIIPVMEAIERGIKSKKDSAAFLRGFFDAEGNLNFSSTRRGREIKISNTDESLIWCAMECLRILNINGKTSLAKGKRENRKKLFNVRMYGKSSIEFIKRVKPFKLQSKEYLEGKVHSSYLHLFNLNANISI